MDLITIVLPCLDGFNHCQRRLLDSADDKWRALFFRPHPISRLQDTLAESAI